MKKSLLLIWVLLLGIWGIGITSSQDAIDVEATDYLYFFGGGGGFAGSTDGISGLVIKSDGNVLVADVFNHISEFNAFGELIEVYETDAAGNGFGHIVAMKIDSLDNLYVVTTDPNAINAYHAAWGLIQTIALEELRYSLYGQMLAYDPINNRIYVLIPSYEVDVSPKIMGFDSAGEVVTEFPLQLSFVGNNQYMLGSIAVSADGNIVHSYGGISRDTGDISTPSGATQIYQPDGTLVSQHDFTNFIEEEVATTAGIETFRYFPIPFGLTLDSEGRQYTYDVQQLPPVEFGQPARISGIVTITAPNGTLLRQFTVSQQDSPVGAKMALSPDERLLYVASANYVHIISLTTEPPFTSIQMADNGRLRAAPVDGAVVDSVAAGTILIVTGQNDAGDWLQVRHEGADVWVAKFLTQPLNR